MSAESVAEEARAEAYREQQRRRLAYKVAAEAALRPDPALTVALMDGWRALLDFDRFGVPRVGVEVEADDPYEEPSCLP
jgi:hypothetical protein